MRLGTPKKQICSSSEKNTEIFSFFGHHSKGSLLSYLNVSPLSKTGFHLYTAAST